VRAPLVLWFHKMSSSDPVQSAGQLADRPRSGEGLQHIAAIFCTRAPCVRGGGAK
jgi:hypothetical protein